VQVFCDRKTPALRAERPTTSYCPDSCGTQNSSDFSYGKNLQNLRALVSDIQLVNADKPSIISFSIALDLQGDGTGCLDQGVGFIRLV
jgi:hypothetical protein